MSACWPLQMSPTQKAVLISLADNANDHGHCWPSIEKICERTCLGRTAVIDAIEQLEADNHISADRSNGRKTSYLIHPNQSATRTGKADGPVRQTDQTSPPDGLNQSARRTLTVKNRKEPSLAKSPTVPKPADVPADLWSAFLAVRKAKNAPLTVIAFRGIEREAAKARISVVDALTVCCERNWQTFKVDWWLKDQPAQGRSSDGRLKVAI